MIDALDRQLLAQLGPGAIAMLLAIKIFFDANTVKKAESDLKSVLDTLTKLAQEQKIQSQVQTQVLQLLLDELRTIRRAP